MTPVGLLKYLYSAMTVVRWSLLYAAIARRQEFSKFRTFCSFSFRIWSHRAKYAKFSTNSKISVRYQVSRQIMQFWNSSVLDADIITFFSSEQLTEIVMADFA